MREHALHTSRRCRPVAVSSIDVLLPCVTIALWYKERALRPRVG